MEAQLWRSVYALVRDVQRERPRGSRRFGDWLIVLTLLWAAFNHRPISWAVQRRSWPVWCLRWIPRLPSSTTMSRRLRRESVLEFQAAVLARAQQTLPRSMVLVIDGKPMVIGGGTKDHQAGYGRAVGGKAMGYKLHTLLHAGGRIEGYRIAPMNVPEQTMADRLLRDLDQDGGYTLADGNYDSVRLYAWAALKGRQLVAPRRRPGGGTSWRPQRPERLRSIDLTEGPSRFGHALLHERDLVERWLGNLTSFSAGLGPLPAWVRTHRRVHRWVTAKLTINAVRITLLAHDRAA
jgi:hypothetical protein